MALQIISDSGIDALRCQRIVEKTRAQANRRRARQQKFDRILIRPDTTLADDRNSPRSGFLIDLVYFQQRYRPDRRTRQSSLDVANDGPAGLDIDGQTQPLPADGIRIDPVAVIFENGAERDRRRIGEDDPTEECPDGLKVERDLVLEGGGQVPGTPGRVEFLITKRAQGRGL